MNSEFDELKSLIEILQNTGPDQALISRVTELRQRAEDRLTVIMSEEIRNAIDNDIIETLIRESKKK